MYYLYFYIYMCFCYCDKMPFSSDQFFLHTIQDFVTHIATKQKYYYYNKIKNWNTTALIAATNAKSHCHPVLY